MKAQTQVRLNKLWWWAFAFVQLVGLWQFYGRWLWQRWVVADGG